MSIQKSPAQVPQTALCHNCKSFYGTQKTDWLCSSCFKKGRKQQKVQKVPEIEKVEVKEVAKITEEPKEEEKPEIVQKDKKRCFTCNKKVGLLGVECKCKLVFCNGHRMPQDHNCEFNFREKGQKGLEKALIKVEKGKISQI